MLTLTYPFLPPSLNSTYRAGNGRMYMNSTVKSYKALVTQHTQGIPDAVLRQLEKAQFHKIEYQFYGKFANELSGMGWRTLASKLDFGNEFKALQDAIYSVIGLDDRRICDGHVEHIFSYEPKTIVKIEPTIMKGLPRCNT